MIESTNNRRTFYIVELVLLSLGILICIPAIAISGQWLFLSELSFFNGDDMMANWLLIIFLIFTYLILEVIFLVHLFGNTWRKHSIATWKKLLLVVIINFGFEAVFFLSYWLSWGAGSIYDVPLYFYVFLILTFMELGVLIYLIISKAKYIFF